MNTIDAPGMLFATVSLTPLLSTTPLPFSMYAPHVNQNRLTCDQITEDGALIESWMRQPIKIVLEYIRRHIL